MVARSILASVIGWIIVAIIAWFLLGWIVGTLFWLIRTVLIVVVIFGLITLYFKLKSPKTGT